MNNAVIAAVAAIFGAFLGVLGSGCVQWMIQSREIQHRDQQLRQTLAHDTHRQFLETAWKAKFDAIEALHRHGNLLFIVGWEVLNSNGKTKQANKKRLESLHDQYTAILSNAQFYMTETYPREQFQVLQTHASTIYLSDFSDEESKRREELLSEAWEAFSKELKDYLPAAVLGPGVNPQPDP